MAARSEAKAHAAIEKLYANNKSVAVGKLIFLPLDLADLNSVVEAAEIFLKQESKLDVLGESDTEGLERYLTLLAERSMMGFINTTQSTMRGYLPGTIRPRNRDLK